jgi:hypothetical protein
MICRKAGPRGTSRKFFIGGGSGGGREVQVLGCNTNGALAWKEHVKRAKRTATVALGAIHRATCRTGNFEVGWALKIFDDKVQSKLSYGAEIWGSWGTTVDR